MVLPWPELKHESYGIHLSSRQVFFDPKDFLAYISYGPQIFQPTDSANEEEALLTTQILVKTIYGTDELNVNDTDVQGLAREACEECIGVLKEPEKSQARPAAKILCAFMSTTREYLLSPVILAQPFLSICRQVHHFASCTARSQIIQ